MKFKLKRKQLVELDHVLKTTNFELPMNGRFRYMVTANLKITGEEIKQLNDAFPAALEYIEFKKKEAVVYKTFGVSESVTVDSLEESKKIALEEKLIELRSEFADAFTTQDEINKERIAFMEEDIEVDLKTVKPDDVPDISKDNKYYHWDIWNILALIVVE